MSNTFFFIIKTLERFETKVARELEELVKQEVYLKGIQPIVSIIVPPNVKGCVIVEGVKKHEIIPLINKIKQARGFLKGKITLEEVYNLAKPPLQYYPRDTRVEIIEGAFKGCEGQVLEDDGYRVVLVIIDWGTDNRVTISRSQVREKR